MSIVPPSPKPAPCAQSRMKVHLRLVTLGREVYRIVTLRSGTRILYSTNFYHDTWHIVTCQHGARLLARLIWGLAFDRHPGTMILVHGDHLATTPFEAERSDPFLIARAGQTQLDP